MIHDAPKVPLGHSLPVPGTNIIKAVLARHRPQQNKAKQELLEAIAPVQRGLTATEEDAANIETLAQRLEKLNPTPKWVKNGRALRWFSSSVLQSEPAFQHWSPWKDRRMWLFPVCTDGELSC